jgi:hypothetical protein
VWLPLIRLPQIRKHVDPVTGLELPYAPLGRFIHIAPPCPRSDWATDFGKPWWRDEAYVVGRRTARTRRVRIVNMLADQRHTIEVRFGGWVCRVVFVQKRHHTHTGRVGVWVVFQWPQNAVLRLQRCVIQERAPPHTHTHIKQLMRPAGLQRGAAVGDQVAIQAHQQPRRQLHVEV